MRRGAHAGLALALLILAPSAANAADSGTADKVESLNLGDGRVLHHVRTLSDEGSSIVVAADEGIVKIDKADLPDGHPSKRAGTAVAGPELVMQPFNPDIAPTEPGREPGTKMPGAKPAAPVGPKARPAANPVFSGCTLASFQIKAFQGALGCAEVVIRNSTDAAVVIRPGDLVCVGPTGAKRYGRSFISDGFPPVVRRRVVVPAQGEISDTVTFTAESQDTSSVQWAR